MKKKLGLILLIAIVVVSLLVTACGVSSQEQQAQMEQLKADAKAFIQTEVSDQVGKIPVKPGPQGIAGAIGPIGTKGEQGAKGVDGVQGVQGSQGIAGAQGEKGKDGSSGGSGGPGATGATGAKGVTGATGATGAPGFPVPPLYDVKLATRFSGTGSTTATATMSNANTNTGLWAAHLTTGVERGAGDTATVRLIPLSPMTLGDIQTIEWSAFAVKGYPPHVDIRLDLDGDDVWSDADDALVFEYAYNPVENAANGQPDYGVTLGEWFSTFEDAIVDGTANAWATRGAPGPLDGSDQNFIFRTFTEWLAGVTYTLDVERTINATSPILRLDIEVDNWIPTADVEAFVDDIKINGIPVYWIP